MNTGWLIAAILALGTWALHTFVGGPQVAGPLLRTEMRSMPKYTNYYCWHLVTLTLLAMAAAYGYAGVWGRPDLAVFATLLAASYAAWSIVLVVWKKRHPFELPQWSLFLAIAAAGCMGMLR